jgi:hypothetical protein
METNEKTLGKTEAHSVFLKTKLVKRIEQLNTESSKAEVAGQFKFKTTS